MQIAKHCLCLLLCFLLLAQQAQAYTVDGNLPTLSPHGAQAAQVLGVTTNVERVAQLRPAAHAGDVNAQRELLLNKSVIVRKILIGYLDVRQISDKIEVDLGRAYDSLAKTSRKRAQRVQLFTLANFAQYAVNLSTAAALRMHQQFHAAIALTNVSAGLTVILSTLGLWSGFAGKSHDKVPPIQVTGFLDPNAPSSLQLPKSLHAFINLPEPGQTTPRRAKLIAEWNSKYHIDISGKDAMSELFALREDKDGESLRLLKKRMKLLYSIKDCIRHFDHDLLVLLTYVQSHSHIESEPIQQVPNLSSLTANAQEGARLLKIEAEVAKLIELRRKNSYHIENTEQLRLELMVLSRILGGALAIRSTVDRIDQEKDYEFDVVLSQLYAARDRAVLLANTANFTEIGAMKSTAAGCFWKGNAVAGTELLMIMAGISMFLGAAALQLGRGGKRRLDSYTNVLANVFNLDATDEDRFHPVISDYVNSVPPNSTPGLTRRQILINRWKEHKVIGKADNTKDLKKLASMQELKNKKVDTISLVNRRLRMLFDTRAMIEGMDADLQELLAAVS